MFTFNKIKNEEQFYQDEFSKIFEILINQEIEIKEKNKIIEEQKTKIDDIEKKIEEQNENIKKLLIKMNMNDYNIINKFSVRLYELDKKIENIENKYIN